MYDNERNFQQFNMMYRFVFLHSHFTYVPNQGWVIVAVYHKVFE